MGILYSLGASGLLFVVSFVLLYIRPRFFAIPWMGMAIVIHFWRGTGPQMIYFAVRDYSPVEMALGQPYLIFASGRADPEQLPGHWSADFPTHVWTPRADQFFPFPGLPRDEPISRDFLESFLESQTYIGE